MNVGNREIPLKQILLQYGVTVIVILFAATVLSRVVDVTTLGNVIEQTRPVPYVIAIALFYVTFPLRAIRWSWLLANVDVEADRNSATFLLLLNWFLNTILPAKAGDVHRSFVGGREYETSTATVLGTIVTERALDLSVLAIGVVLAMGLTLEEFSNAQQQVVWLAFGLLFLIGGVMAAIVFLQPSLLPEVVQPLLADFRQGITSIRTPRDGIGMLGLTVVIWGLNVVRMGMVGIAIGFQIDITLLVLTALLVAFLSGLPYTPAGLGVVELITTTVLIQAGVSESLGFSFILFDRFITVGTLVIIGAVAYLYFKFVRQRR
jgi:uncharacterized membrane protein YbhN (UPF0104 family)